MEKIFQSMRIKRFNENQQYLTQPYDPDERFSEIDEEDEEYGPEVKVYEDKIKKFFRTVAEGVNEVEIDESEHEVTVLINDNAWGGIDLEEWNSAKTKLSIYVGKDGFKKFNINTSGNLITLKFDEQYQIGLY